MNYRPFVLFLAVILAVTGAFLSGVLLSQHIPNAKAPDWFKAVCSSEANAAFDCSSVLNSRWAYFPPKSEDGTPNKYSRPAALWGLWYFTFMAAWYLFIGYVDYPNRKWHLVATLCNLAGLLGAGYFVWVMMTKMDSKCLWCLITHGINLLLMICTLWLWPRSRAVEQSRTAEQSRAREEAVLLTEHQPEPLPYGHGSEGLGRAHPGLRLILATLSIAGLAMFAELHVVNSYANKVQLVEYMKYHESLKKDIGFLVTTFQNQEKKDIPIRSDDPVRGEGPNMIETVVFSDFTCPMCRSFAKTLDEELNKLFEGKLKIVFKHFPACVDCNPLVPRTIPGHEAACLAAQAAEAARMQGGSAAFWKAHDWLFSESKSLKTVDWAAFAGEMGLDPARFESDMNSEAVKKRIVEDVELAKSVGVTGTPTVFLSGRQLSHLLRTSDVFWKEMKKTYDANMKKRNAPKAPPEVQTPDEAQPDSD